MAGVMSACGGGGGILPKMAPSAPPLAIPPLTRRSALPFHRRPSSADKMGVDAYFMVYDTDHVAVSSRCVFWPGKRVVLGVMTSKSSALESKDQLKRRINEAAKSLRSSSFACRLHVASSARRRATCWPRTSSGPSSPAAWRWRGRCGVGRVPFRQTHLTLRSARRARLEGWATTGEVAHPSRRIASDAPQGEGSFGPFQCWRQSIGSLFSYAGSRLIDNIPSAINSARSLPSPCERHLVEFDCHLQW